MRRAATTRSSIGTSTPPCAAQDVGDRDRQRRGLDADRARAAGQLAAAPRVSSPAGSGGALVVVRAVLLDRHRAARRVGRVEARDEQRRRVARRARAARARPRTGSRRATPRPTGRTGRDARASRDGSARRARARPQPARARRRSTPHRAQARPATVQQRGLAASGPDPDRASPTVAASMRIHAIDASSAPANPGARRLAVGRALPPLPRPGAGSGPQQRAVHTGSARVAGRPRVARAGVTLTRARRLGCALGRSSGAGGPRRPRRPPASRSGARRSRACRGRPGGSRCGRPRRARARRPSGRQGAGRGRHAGGRSLSGRA